MRDPNRIRPILDRLERVWKAHPDLRLCQLIMNMTTDEALYTFYSKEDEELAEQLEDFYKNV